MLSIDLISYLNRLLKVENYKDYAPNGLQVEGKKDIQKIITGVTACEALIDAAIDEKADAVLVHHGYFWKNEPATITGMKYHRIKKLIQHDINLIGYHLPLDGHPIYGNNAQLANLWGIKDITPDTDSLVRLGRVETPMTIQDFTQLVATSLSRRPLHLPGGPEEIHTVSWCSGGAQGYIQKAIDWQADVYISGEVSEQTTHQALENQIHYLAAGHHATERLGVQSLGRHLSEKFSLEVKFIEIKNPV